MAACQTSKSRTCWRANRPANPVPAAHKTHSSQAWCCFMRRHTADVQARRQDGGAGRALRHLGDPVGKFFPLKILAGILYFPVPGVEKKKKLPVPRVTEISTVHLFISNLTRAVWGLPMDHATGTSTTTAVVCIFQTWYQHKHQLKQYKPACSGAQVPAHGRAAV